MKSIRIMTVLIAMVMSLSLAIPASAQPAGDQIDQALGNAEESYSRGYTLTEPATSTPESGSGSMSAIVSVILVMSNEDEAERLYNLFMEMSDEEDYSFGSIEGLGDEAAFIIEPSPGGAENIMMVRDSTTIVIAVASDSGPDRETQEALVRHILETGPSGEEVVIDGQGFITGGWADAYPEPEDVPGLEPYTATPVIVFGLTQPATPAPVSPFEVSTPAS